jgi:hypothetical protein
MWTGIIKTKHDGILCVEGSVAILHILFGMLHWCCSLPNYVSIPIGLKIQY